MIVDEYKLMAMINRWEPPKTPHCSNCRHARVSGRSDDPVVRCAADQGKIELPLFKLIRPSHSVQFRPASQCPYFETMSDEL